LRGGAPADAEAWRGLAVPRSALQVACRDRTLSLVASFGDG